MLNHGDHESAQALGVLHSVLDGLVQSMQPVAGADGDPELAEMLIAEALQLSVAAGLHGVSAMLRIATNAISRNHDLLDQTAVRNWFEALLAYCRNELAHSPDEQLVDALAALPDVAGIPPKLRIYLLDRLRETRSDLPRLLRLSPDRSPEDPATQIEAVGVLNEVGFGQPVEPEPVAAPATIVGPADNAFSEPDSMDRRTRFNEAEGPFLPALPVETVHTTGTLAETVSVEAHPEEPGHDAFHGTDASSQSSMAGSSEGIEAAAGAIPEPPEQLDPLIWISKEELALAVDAVGNQILPAICALSEDLSTDQRGELLAELEFNLELVANALEVMGTITLSGCIRALGQYVAGSTTVDATILINASAAVVRFLEDPGAERVDAFDLLRIEWSDLDEDWYSAMAQEAARIRVGFDPVQQANRQTEATTEDASLELASDVLPSVLEGMMRELPGNAAKLGKAIRWMIAKGERASIDEARRVAHTLKGDANTVGVRGLATLSHALEDVLTHLNKHPECLNEALGEALDAAADCIEEIADFLLGTGGRPDQVKGVVQSMLDWSNRLGDGWQPQARPEQIADDAHAMPEGRGLPDAAAGKGEEPSRLPDKEGLQDSWRETRTPTLNVSAVLLDDLQRVAGETQVLSKQIEQRLSQLEVMYKDQLAESRNTNALLSKLDDLISLRGAALQSTALRDGVEIDPLELDQYNDLHVVSRQLIESQADSLEHQRRIDALLVEFDEIRSQQEAIHAELQRNVQLARTVPFDRISGRLQRIVRQTSRQLSKDVALAIVGEQTMVESDLLDQIVEPLGHLLRNAIDHGIEDDAERARLSKPEQGKITVTIDTVGDSIRIRIEDDGRGLDYQRIREKAMAVGLLDSQASPGDQELAQLILTAGFTTKPTTTQVSGRGIGMDVVNQRILAMRGQLALSSSPGKGLLVRMLLPQTQSLADVVIAYGHGVISGAVASSVSRVHSYQREELILDAEGQPFLKVEEDLLPLIPIETVYGLPPGRQSVPVTGSGLGLLITTVVGRKVVVGVNRVGDVGRFIVKPISAHLPPIPAVRGMTLLGDGSMASVVDLSMLVDLLFDRQIGTRALVLGAEQAELPRVVVADDSLSVRRALSELLEDAGYQVTMARDGLEALDRINAEKPVMVLLDLEMPKLNGLEVTRYMRNQEHTRNVPVLMISSRASEKYRIQAEHAGVTRMLGKPFSEDELLATVRALTNSNETFASEVIV